jgi:F0F1-type ATP synthase assembly protein I
MEENQNKSKNLSVGAALGVFSEISGWIIVPVILAVVVGKPLDIRYNSAPVILLVSATLGFLISSYGIVHSVKKYAAKIKKEEGK